MEGNLLDVEEEMHDVAVLYEVILSLDAEFAGGTALRFASKGYEVLVFDYLSTDESALKIRMDHSGTLRRFHPLSESPCAYFIRAGGKESAQFEKGICCFDEPVHAGLLQTDFAEEHLPLLVGLQFRYLALDLCRQNEDLGVFVFDSLLDLLDIGIAGNGRAFIHVADIHDGFVGQQEEILGCGFLIFVIQFNRTCVLSLGKPPAFAAFSHF